MKTLTGADFIGSLLKNASRDTLALNGSLLGGGRPKVDSGELIVDRAEGAPAAPADSDSQLSTPQLSTTARNRREMNQTERAFFALLEERRLAGEFREVAYEPFALPVEGGMTYTPDFVAVRDAVALSIAELQTLARGRGIDACSCSLWVLMKQLLLMASAGTVQRVICFEVKGPQIWDKNRNKFKQARERYPWARFEMWQRGAKKDGWAWKEVARAD